MTVATVGRAVATRTAGKAAARQGAGKVIDVTPSSSRPLRNVRPASSGSRASSAAGGYGLGRALGEAAGRRSSSSGSSSSGRGSSSRKLLVAEFLLCMVVLAFSPVTDKHKTEKPGAFMKRASATMGVFFFLGLISTAGRGAGRAAAAFGGLMTLVLLISSRSIFTVLAKKMAPGVGEGYTVEDAGEGVADIIGDVADIVTDESDDQGVPDPGTRPTPNTGLTPLFPGGIGQGAGMR